MIQAPTLPELLRERVAATPDLECLRFEGRSLTFGEVLERATRLAGVLAGRGIRSGDRVALMLPNGLEFPVAWLALPFLRAVAVPVNPGYRGRDLAHVLRHSGARLILVDPDLESEVQAVRDRCPALEDVCVWGPRATPVEQAPRGTVDLDAPEPVQPTDPVTIQYTSGTTGFPKGCVLDHTYWLTLARCAQRHARLGPGDVALTAQLQSYMDPSWNLVLCLIAGVPLVVLRRFSATGFWESVRDNRATFFYCIGTMPMYLMRQPADPRLDRDHSVRLVYCSGIPPAMHAAFEARWGALWRETYGTTELGAVLMAPPEDHASVGSASMGGVVTGREVRVVDEAGTDVPRGEIGELWVRGSGVMQGYHDDPEATRAWKPDGWARTGDLVVQDGPDRFRLVGRTKDMIRRGGENISAAEVESVLVEHPGVRAAACIRVPDPDRGEEVKAYVQPVRGAVGPDPAGLRAFVAQRLAPFKIPRYIELVDALPLTASEKVAKAELIGSRADHRLGAWDANTGDWILE